MKVAIDVRKLHDFGIGTYIRNLLRELARLDRNTEFVLLCRPDDVGALAALGENFRPVVQTAGNYSISEQLRVPLALRREGVTQTLGQLQNTGAVTVTRGVLQVHDRPALERTACECYRIIRDLRRSLPEAA